MPRVTYHEFRPGHWVKLVDGQVAGPATADEVAKWRRETAEPDKIWQDVVEETTPAQAESVAPQDLVADTGIWQDVVSQVTPPSAKPEPAAKRAAEAELPPAAKAPPPKRAVEPGPRSKAEIAPVSKQAEPSARRKVEAAPAKEAPEALPAAPAKATPVRDFAGPKPTGASLDEEAVTSQPVSVRAAMPPSGTTAEPEVRVKDAASTKAEKREPVRTLEAEAGDKVQPQRRRAGGTAAAKKAAKPKPAPAVEAVSDQKVEETEPGPAPIVAAPVQATQAKQAPRSRKRTTRRRTRAAAGAKSRKAAGPSYLWVMAGPADDLMGAVRGGLARYEERFNEPAGTVLCHADDLPVLEQAGLAVDLRQGKGVPPRSFWIGPK